MQIDLKHPVKVEATVSLNLPEEVLVLLRDLHGSRESIALGFGILIAYLCGRLLRPLFSK